MRLDSADTIAARNAKATLRGLRSIIDEKNRERLRLKRLCEIMQCENNRLRAALAARPRKPFPRREHVEDEKETTSTCDDSVGDNEEEEEEEEEEDEENCSDFIRRADAPPEVEFD